LGKGARVVGLEVDGVELGLGKGAGAGVDFTAVGTVGDFEIGFVGKVEALETGFVGTEAAGIGFSSETGGVFAACFKISSILLT